MKGGPEQSQESKTKNLESTRTNSNCAEKLTAEDHSEDILHAEDEQTRLRAVYDESKAKSTNVTDDSTEKKPKRIPFFIRMLNSIHFCLVGVFLLLAINFFFEYANIKNYELFEAESHVKLGKALICVVLAIFFAYAKVVLMESYADQ
ncbi:uncharacterized protein VICG_00730 [Vittaforma corneae ATCC 50505]|uniref:Uncharacterized protein n=1 Tax=Vittaforma corneae (strain ATCC 50505) TaxID=993615 RepID=L2GP87_VITCO|nr:uncharacterized protein VICG_00730 [Vittaforma corneae ATCC 50505]ELA42330.1 hypothetical protein VICG_00730 [Vittaforma corneae ATCC 50505]